MGSIRKQTIVSSILVYIGFGIGAINTWIYTKDHFLFTPAQYALIGLFPNVGQLIFCFASLSSLTVLNKFYPYYKDNLPDNKNDLFTRTLIINLIGTVLVVIAGFIFEPLVVQKFSEHSKMFVDYYHLTFVFGFGITLFSLLEAYSWSIHKTILPNFLRETGLRLLTSFFIVLYFFKAFNFRYFMVLYSALYLVIAVILFTALVRSGQVHLVFKVSRVTKKFNKKMLLMQGLLFGGVTIITIGQTIDGVIIASLRGLDQTAYYTLATYAANLVQVPQRSILAVSTGAIARAWKDKNYAEINRIYGRSSINLLILGLFIFGCVWLNAADGIKTLHINTDFNKSLAAILVIGLIRIVDAGTGVNQTIIATSNKWTFEFYSGIIMLAVRITLAYTLVKQFGMIGSAYAELIVLSLFNFVRFEFLRRVYNMQPFSLKTLYALILAVVSYFVAYLPFKEMDGWVSLAGRTVLFSIVMIGGTFVLKLTPDAEQLLHNFKKRLGFRKE